MVHFTIKAHRAKDIAATEWIEKKTEELSNASNTKVLPSKALFKEVAPTPTQVRPLHSEEYGNLQEAPKKTTQTPVFNMFDDDGTESNVNFADETVLKKQAAEWF